MNQLPVSAVSATSSDGAPLARYAPFRRAGDFLLLSGVIAVDPVARKVIRGYEDLPPEVAQRIGMTGEFSVDVKEGPVVAQSWYVLDCIRRLVESQGGSMQDAIKLVQYFRNLDHFPLYNRVRRMFYPEDAPASTVVQVSGLMPTDDVLIEVEATVYLPLKKD